MVCTVSRWPFDGHRYRPRYDEIPQLVEVRNVRSDQGMAEIIRANTKRVYVADICERCGDVIKRSA